MSVTSRPEPLRGRALDPVLVGLVAFGVIALHGWSGRLSRDLGVFTYGGLHVLDGIPPYVGIFNSVGPLADMVPALGIWLGRLVGAGPVLSERVLFAAITAGCCALAYLLARDLFGSRAVAFVAPAVLLVYRTFLILASDGPREKTTMVLFLIATLVLVGRRRWWAAGATTALATLTWQPALAPALVAAIVAIAMLRTGRLRAIAELVVGGAVPSALLMAYFAVHGDLHVAFQGFLFINLDYTHQPSIFHGPRSIVHALERGYGGTLWIFLAGLIALFVLAVVALARGSRRDPLLAVAAGGLAATVWTMAVINGSPDLFVVLPFAAVGTAGTVAALAARLQPRDGRAMAGVVAAVLALIASFEAIGTREQGLTQQEADIAAVLAAAPHHASVLSVNAPEVLALANRTNASQYQVFTGSEDNYLAHTYPGGLKGLAAWVVHQHPALIAVGHKDLPHWARPLLKAHYFDVGSAGEWSWYVLRKDGTATATHVLDANWSVTHPYARAAPKLSLAHRLQPTHHRTPRPGHRR